MKSSEDLRLQHTLWIALAGLGAVLFAFAVTLWALGHDPEARKTIPAVIAPILTVIGTLVGAVAGHSAELRLGPEREKTPGLKCRASRSRCGYTRTNFRHRQPR
jgi:hypothetical protein